MSRWLGLVLFLALLGACDGDRGDGDAGLADAGPADASPLGPLDPAPPSLTPCRAGWTEGAGADGVTRCEPWPGARPTCTGATAAFVGEADCAPIGTPCGADRFATELPATGVLFVDGSAAPGGDGTRSAPFATIAEAFAVATEGTTVALAKGTYRGRVVVPAGVTVRGACVAETTITDTFQLSGGTVMAAGLGTRLANVRVAGASPGIWIEGPGVSMEIEAVLIEETTITALGVFEAEVSARELVVRDTNAFDGYGRGAIVEASGTLELERAVLERVRESGIVANEGTAILRDVAVLDVQLEGAIGDGVSSARGGAIVAEGLVIENSPTLGAFAILAESALTFTDVVIRGGGDDGMQLVDGARGALTRVRFEANAGIGVLAGLGSTLEATDLVVIGGDRGVSIQEGATGTLTRVLAQGGAGTAFIAQSPLGAPPSRLDLTDALARGGGGGITLQEGSSGSVTRARVEGARGVAVVLRGEGTVVDVQGLTIRDVTTDPDDGSPGRGLELRVGANGTIRGLRVERAEELGVFVEEASGELSDVIVSETRARPDGLFGRGVEVEDSDVRWSDVELRGNHEVGLLVGRGSQVELSELAILDTQPQVAQGLSGAGMIVNGAASVTATQLTLRGNHEVSLAAFEVGTSVVVRDATITETRERPCATTTCPGFGAGVGVGSYLGASIDLERFDVSSHPLAGLQVADDGMLAVRDGRVADNPIGVNVQVEGFDYGRVQDRVEYVGNDRNVDAALLPVPAATDPLGGT